MTQKQTLHRSDGMSLLEILVCLLITSFMMLIIVRQHTIFTRQLRDTAQTLEQDAEILGVAEMLRNSIQAAGFTPCGGIAQLIHKPDPMLNAIDIGDGHEIYLRRMSPPIQLIKTIVAGTELYLSQALPNNTQSVVIADCYHAELHTAKILGRKVFLSAPLYYRYHDPIYIGSWISEHFWLRKNYSPALYYKKQHAEVLTDKINQFSVKVNGNNVYLGLNATEVVARMRM